MRARQDPRRRPLHRAQHEQRDSHRNPRAASRRGRAEDDVTGLPDADIQDCATRTRLLALHRPTWKDRKRVPATIAPHATTNVVFAQTRTSDHPKSATIQVNYTAGGNSYMRAYLMRAAGRPVRPVRQPLQPARLIPGQPGMHALPGNTPPASHLSHRAALADHRQDSLIPLLSHAQLPHARECQGSAEAAVKDQPKHCQPSAGGRMPSISRPNTAERWG